MVKYLEKNNVLKAWRQGLVDLYHDVSQDRAVFLIKKDGKPVDAVGRALKYGMKWLRYGKSIEPFVVKTDPDYAILVEDAASACAVSEYGTGIALLGTSLTDRILEVASTYRSVTVALDRDAFSKSLAFTRRLRQYTVANAKLLREDPKVYPRGVIE
jgi:DNA primase